MDNILNKRNSKYIKAIGIVMMVTHHFFAFPDKWLQSNLFISIGNIAGRPVEQMVGEMCKLCVCIFAFISGYGTFISFRKKKDKKERTLYCVNKIVKLVFIYWMTILCFFVPIAYVFKKNITMLEILNNLLLMSTSLIHTGWYVAFYIKAILCILIYSFIEKERSWIFDCIVCFGIPAIVEMCNSGNLFSHYYPVFMLGYIFKKYKLYEIYEKNIQSQIVQYSLSIGMLILLLVIRLKFGDTIGLISLITFMGPIICYVLVIILNYISQFKCIEKPLMILSKYCTWYWFLHAIFHFGILEIQKIGYMPKIPILIIAWVFLILTPIAIVLQEIYNIFIKRIISLRNWYPL